MVAIHDIISAFVNKVGSPIMHFLYVIVCMTCSASKEITSMVIDCIQYNFYSYIDDYRD